MLPVPVCPRRCEQDGGAAGGWRRRRRRVAAAVGGAASSLTCTIRTLCIQHMQSAAAPVERRMYSSITLPLLPCLISRTARARHRLYCSFV